MSAVAHPHALPESAVLARLGSSARGLDPDEVRARLLRWGPNILAHARPPTTLAILARQFRSPLVYVLLCAAVFSLLLGTSTDAAFIAAVVALNAAVGTFQESRAERSAQALQSLVASQARVLRAGEVYEVAADSLVPGDIVLLQSGDKVPADLRLIDAHRLGVDESMLSGESMPADKCSAVVLGTDAALPERANMAFAGTLVNSGRARGVVVATGAATELGRIASAVLGGVASRPPLILRMERFTRRVVVGVGAASLLLVAVCVLRGQAPREIVLLAVALAVSAIPEGLPVALTVALAVGMERMARRAVIVRRLLAVEALGSCTYIAADKTGTLTVNQLTVRRVQLPGQAAWGVSGEGLLAQGAVLPAQGATLEEYGPLLEELARACVLANEATLTRRGGDEWVGQGDSVDVALLVFARKVGISQPECLRAWPRVDALAYEPGQRFAASLHRRDGIHHPASPVPAGQAEWAFAKGAVETLLPMCRTMSTNAGPVAVEADAILARARSLAAQGYRVLGVACGARSSVARMRPSRPAASGVCAFAGCSR